MKLRILLLFVALACVGQTMHRRFLIAPVPVSSGPWTPSNSIGLAYWWVATDLASNAPVSSWADRIQGKTFTQGTAASKPTNYHGGLVGVRFNGGQYLSTTGFLIRSNFTDSFAFILALDSETATMRAIVTDDGTYGIFKYNSADQPFYCRLSGGALFACPLNVIWDVVASGTATNDIYYSNSITAKITTLQSEVRNDITVSVMGRRSTVNYLLGRVVEFMVWTNTRLSQADVQKIHTYGTNLYGYSP